MNLLRDGWTRKVLVVTFTFCIISGAHSLPVYPPGYPGVDPYPVSSYPGVDPYAGSSVYVPSVDVYYQVPQPVAYPAVDPYGLPQPYPSVDPYAVPQPYPSVDPYAYPQPYPSVDPYAVPQPVPYPSVDPYGQPVLYPAVADPYQPVLYPPVDPYQPVSAYPVPPPQPYPSVDPYAQQYSVPPPQPYPSVDPYAIPQPQPYPSLDPYGLSIPQNYQVAPIYQPPQPSYAPVVEELDTYLAVNYHEHHLSRKHCGILAATNDDIYSSDPSPGGVNDVLPYGAFPWLALIVDNDDNTVVCLGTVIHSEYVLTAASCITKPAGKYSVVKDWDILTIYNEYEAYKSYADPVCTYWPLGLDNSTEQTQYRLGGPESELILLIGPLEEHHDQYPADKILCLPSKASALPAPYGYPQPSPYVPSLYSPYPQLSYDYSNSYIPTGECWVAGYLYSPNAILQNHPPTTPLGGQQQPPYNQQYYNNLDNSKVPRRALVRQIQCPVDHPYPGGDDVCFVGVNGYDACVADVGTAVACVIEDNTEYESGFDTDSGTDHGSHLDALSVNAPPPPPAPPVQQQPFQVMASPPKPNRRRAILYAVVKSTTTCMPPSALGYPPNPQQQSNYIVGARISPSIKGAIQDLFWETGYDLSCPTERVGEVLPQGLAGQPGSSLPPPLPYSLSSLQPQQYDPSLSMLSSYPQPSYSYPQPSYSYPQPSYSYPQPSSYVQDSIYTG